MFQSTRPLLFALAVCVPASSSIATQKFSPLYAYRVFAGAASTGATDGSAEEARFNGPWGIASDGAGNLYVAEYTNVTIRKITTTGLVSTLAGMPGVFGTDDGTGVTARFGTPGAVALDPAGNLYVTQPYSGTIRKITPAGAVSTLAGSPGTTGSNDGQGSLARFNQPLGIAVDAAGNVFVADFLNHTIRKVTSSGSVSTWAGAAGVSGSADGGVATARFNLPSQLAFDSQGNLYVADGGNATIRKITPAGDVTTLAGSAGNFGYADGVASAARFSSITGIAADGSGNVYVAELGRRIRRVRPDGTVTTFAGSVDVPGSTDGQGAAVSFGGPRGLACDSAGNVYVADSSNHNIRKLTPAGTSSTIAGLAPDRVQGYVDGSAKAARFNTVSDIARDSAGNLYVTDAGNHVVRKIAPDGTTSTLAGSAGQPGKVDGTGTAAKFNRPASIAIDGAGNVYVHDYSNTAIRKVSPSGVVTTLVTSPFSIFELAADNAGNVYYTMAEQGQVVRIGTTLSNMVWAGVVGFPGGIAADGNGNVYVTGLLDRLIYRIGQGAGAQVIAGGAFPTGVEDDGPALSASFGNPSHLATDADGNLYILQSSAPGSIRRLTPAGEVTTLAGIDFSQTSNANILGLQNSFIPTGLAASANGTIYLAVDSAIWVGRPAAAPTIGTQPQSQSVATGGNVQFSVSASGAPDPTYQWYFNGAPFNGATGSTLSFGSARSTDAGDYTVVITNSLGSVTSSKAVLTVNTSSGGGGGSGGGGSGGGGGGGGGGAPSWGFVSLLVLLAGVRRVARR